MKKFINVVLVVLSVLAMVGCAANGDESAVNGDEVAGEILYIEPAQLTGEENDIAELLGANTSQPIFDFVLDDTIQTIQVNTYRLIDGRWEMEVGGGGQAFTDKEGRLALAFEKLPEGIRIALQSENIGCSTDYKSEQCDDLKDTKGYATTVLSDRVEIVYEEEIPLVVQVFTSKNEIEAYGVDYFNYPETYEKLGYEGVFAVTIRFSQKAVGESAEDAV